MTTPPTFKPVRIYTDAHTALKALTEYYKGEWGYRNLTMTEYLSKLIINTATQNEILIQPKRVEDTQ